MLGIRTFVLRVVLLHHSFGFGVIDTARLWTGIKKISSSVAK
jgi:hypothetical protein